MGFLGEDDRMIVGNVFFLRVQSALTVLSVDIMGPSEKHLVERNDRIRDMVYLALYCT